MKKWLSLVALCCAMAVGFGAYAPEARAAAALTNGVLALKPNQTNLIEKARYRCWWHNGYRRCGYTHGWRHRYWRHHGYAWRHRYWRNRYWRHRYYRRHHYPYRRHYYYNSYARPYNRPYGYCIGLCWW
ncbi:MAG: hypothetical protein JSR99_19310 [Proteobacteria bacterium]|nr:hypothetical protein [Pseudomonadota bacterium]